jgi:hypothetical protein
VSAVAERDEDINELRGQAGLPPFEDDIFISWRYGNGNDTKAAQLKGVLERELGAKVRFFTAVQADLATTQRNAVRAARVVIFLLENKGLNNGNVWGQQYEELAAVADVFRDAENAYPTSGDAITPLTFACYFGVPGEDSKPTVVDRILPSLETANVARDLPRARNDVRKLLLDHTGWHFVNEANPLGQDPQWHREILSAIEENCAQRNRRFSNGQMPLRQGRTRRQKSDADDVKLLSNFNPVEYLEHCMKSWKRGYAHYLLLPSGINDLEIPPDHRILLPGQIPILRENRTEPKEIADACDYLIKTNDSLWVLGQPGAGKTTVVTQAAAAEADEYRHFVRDRTNNSALGTSPRCPFVFSLKRIFSKLNDLGAGEQPLPLLLIAMAQEIAEQGIPCSAKALEAFLRDNNWTIYLDGFDEIPDEGKMRLVNLIDRAIPNTQGDGKRLIVSCRIGHEAKTPWSFSKLALKPLTGADLDSFVKKLMPSGEPYSEDENNVFQRNFAAIRTAFDAGEVEGGPLRTPFFLTLLLREDLQNRDISGSGPMIYLKILSNLFESVSRKADNNSLQSFDPIRALTDLARYVFFKRRSIDEEMLSDAARRGLDKLPQAPARSVREQRRKFLIHDTSVLGPSSETLGQIAFRHSIFVEYLVAADLARSWSQKKPREVLIEIFGPGAPFQVPAPAAELVDRIICIFFDPTIFPGIAESEASKLATSFCRALGKLVATTSLSDEAARARAGRAFVQLIRGIQGARRELLTGDRRRCLAVLLTSFRARRLEWTPLERETALSAIAEADESVWQSISGASKPFVELPATQIHVPRWPDPSGRMALAPKLRVSRKPVLVSEYRKFALAPDRYDHQFWPMRTEEEKALAESQLIAPLKNGRASQILRAKDSRYCVVADVSETNTRVHLHWREQICHPFRPVTNVTWWESVAYALWLSVHEGRRWQLPGPIEWSAIASAIRTAEGEAHPIRTGAPRGNIRGAGLNTTSTIGVFPPNALGLVDFGSNVSIWFADFDPASWTTIWPSREKLEVVFHSGLYYLSGPGRTSLDLKPLREGPEERQGFIGVWLVEV